MRVTVNGEPKEIREHLSVAELLEESLAQRPVESITILSRDGEPAKKSDDHH